MTKQYAKGVRSVKFVLYVEKSKRSFPVMLLKKHQWRFSECLSIDRYVKGLGTFVLMAQTHFEWQIEAYTPSNAKLRPRYFSSHRSNTFWVTKRSIYTFKREIETRSTFFLSLKTHFEWQRKTYTFLNAILRQFQNAVRNDS